MVRVVFLFISIIISLLGFTQKNCDFTSDLNSLNDLLSKYHIQTRDINDKWSEDVYDYFLSMLDPAGILFLEKDITSFQSFETLLDNEMRSENCKFFEKVMPIYKKRLQESDSIISLISKKPFNLKEKKYITLSQDEEISYPKDEKEKYDKWALRIRYLTLKNIFNAGADSIDPFKQSTLELLEKEPEMRIKACNREKKRIRHILEYEEGFDYLMKLYYMNSVTSIYDPHTMYLSKNMKENFLSSISTHELSYGMDIYTHNDGSIRIMKLIPGGPAWKSNELHYNDILVKAFYNGKTVDFSEIEISEANEILHSTNVNTIELSIKNTLGLIKTITLAKEELRVEENIINSYLLEGNRKIGYLCLPAFYTGYENNNSKGCANDVAKEILKLQRELSEALILDLRDNGGGSMDEAYELAGIFIDQGNLCIIKYRDDKPFIGKDMNRGTLSTGPIILLVNSQSASASELLAATLQDYNAAVIVGTATYGKATSQVVIPNDTAAFNEDMSDKAKHKDYVKLTIGKFYRVTGKSHQGIGVEPDILIPAMMSPFAEKEKDDEYAIANDSLLKKTWYLPQKPFPMDSLKNKSTNRLVQHQRMRRLNSINHTLDSIYNKTITKDLNIDAYRINEKKTIALINELDSLPNHKSNLFTVKNNSYDKAIIDIDNYTKKNRQSEIDNIQNDIFIEEAYMIANDLLNYLNP